MVERAEENGFQRRSAGSSSRETPAVRWALQVLTDCNETEIRERLFICYIAV
jgi:hypothetical protein